jgi:hypothetical protein
VATSADRSPPVPDPQPAPQRPTLPPEIANLSEQEALAVLEAYGFYPEDELRYNYSANDLRETIFNMVRAGEATLQQIKEFAREATLEQEPVAAIPVSEVVHFQIPESDVEPPPQNDKAWIWNGADWSVTDKPGSRYTQQFILRVKGTDGKWHYANATGVSFAEFNRRFTNKKFVADKLHGVTRKKDYEKFKEFCFETWKAQAIRSDLTPHGSAAGNS